MKIYLSTSLFHNEMLNNLNFIFNVYNLIYNDRKLYHFIQFKIRFKKCFDYNIIHEIELL